MTGSRTRAPKRCGQPQQARSRELGDAVNSYRWTLAMTENWRAQMHPRALHRNGSARSEPEPPPELSMDSRAGTMTPPVEAHVVDPGIYRDGQRIENPAELTDTYVRLCAQPGTMAWIGLYRPAEEQLLAVADQFGLHKLAIEDAIVAHQRPKLERYGDTLFVVLRAARYLDELEEVHFGKVHVFVGPHFVLTVRHAEAPDLAAVRRRLQDDPDLLVRGPEAVLYGILDAVVDGYAPVVAGLQHGIDEIETEVFGGDPKVTRRIYELSGEVIEFQRATRPLLDILGGLAVGFDKYGTDEELRRDLADVADHATTVAERVDGFRQTLADILTLNATLVSQAQNEEIRQLTIASYAQNEDVKKVSAWAAILFAPTIVGTMYGMNFTPHARTTLDRRLSVRLVPHADRRHNPLHNLQTPRLALTKPNTTSNERAPRRRVASTFDPTTTSRSTKRPRSVAQPGDHWHPEMPKSVCSRTVSRGCGDVAMKPHGIACAGSFPAQIAGSCLSHGTPVFDSRIDEIRVPSYAAKTTVS